MNEPSLEKLSVTPGVTAPRGFRAAGVAAGIKVADRLDMAMVVSDVPAAVAATFTTNRVCAAPVRLCRKHLAGGSARAVVINSGSANACTGPKGEQDALATARLAAALLDVPVEQVFVCSTGTIGLALPMDRIENGLRLAAGALSPEGGPAAARAIMTTDTVPKEASRAVRVDGRIVHIGGMAKGAGMIEPHMATMLAVLTTDAAVDSASLQACLRKAVDRSFNRICVDGDQSTNDTVLLLANGASGSAALAPGHADWPSFEAAVCDVALNLAQRIVRDGEGATRFVTVHVTGAADDADAERAARAVSRSLLVKTSWYGRDPNWGRLMDAVGYSGAEVVESAIDISVDRLPVVRGGLAAPEYTADKLRDILLHDAFDIHIDLNGGQGTFTVYTCDCSVEYIHINADYTT